MSYITRFKILSLALLFSPLLSGQSADECLRIADDYYAIGEYQEAVYMYRRVLFFDESLAAPSYLHIGESYLSIKHYEAARYYYQLASQRTVSDSLKREIAFRRIASFVLEGKYLYAKNELLSIDADKQPYFERKLHFYTAVIAYKMQDVETAESHFLKVFPEKDHRQLMNYLDEGKKIMQKKPYLALGLSAVLPGLGQAYAGEWMDAANSFFINLLTTSLYIYVVGTYSLVDGLLAVLPWWHRYYVGGFTNAKNSVTEKRSEKLDVVLTDILMLYAMMYE